MSFLEIFNSIAWEEAKQRIYSKTKDDVELAINKSSRLNLDDMASLLSPAAAAYVEPLRERSHSLTLQRFGNIIQLYVPIYLSNECQNICTYCGFSFTNKIPRITLTTEDILNEMHAIKKLGFEHLLIVSGEANKIVGPEYFREALKILRPHFSSLSIEVQPLEEADYKQLINEGLHGVLVYQETYNRDSYKDFHPKGKKSNFEYRLETPDRIGRAGAHRIGLGALIGLEDWRVDTFFVAMHLRYLSKHYWKTRYSVSFPRLRPAEGIVDPKITISDNELVQIISAYRLFEPNLEISLSTREHAKFRDHLVKCGVTSMSAGSRTDPGGYSTTKSALKQFEIHDDRSPSEVAEMLKKIGYQPVWKDWDRTFSDSNKFS